MFIFSSVKDKGLRIKDYARSLKHARGFTLLFAVLVGSLLFAMGIAIANLAIKEIVLSAAGKASETAFFAADTGTECALYFDLVVGKTSAEFPNSSTAPKDADGIIRCNGTDVPLQYEFDSTRSATTTFLMNLSAVAVPSSCVEVKVGKTAPKQNPAVPGRTVIEARGRNDSDCSVDAPSNPGRVERALRVRY